MEVENYLNRLVDNEKVYDYSNVRLTDCRTVRIYTDYELIMNHKMLRVSTEFESIKERMDLFNGGDAKQERNALLLMTGTKEFDKEQSKLMPEEIKAVLMVIQLSKEKLNKTVVVDTTGYSWQACRLIARAIAIAKAERIVIFTRQFFLVTPLCLTSQEMRLTPVTDCIYLFNERYVTLSAEAINKMMLISWMSTYPLREILISEIDKYYDKLISIIGDSRSTDGLKERDSRLRLAMFDDYKSKMAYMSGSYGIDQELKCTSSLLATALNSYKFRKEFVIDCSNWLSTVEISKEVSDLINSLLMSDKGYWITIVGYHPFLERLRTNCCRLLVGCNGKGELLNLEPLIDDEDYVFCANKFIEDDLSQSVEVIRELCDSNRIVKGNSRCILKTDEIETIELEDESSLMKESNNDFHIYDKTSLFGR